LQEVEYTKVMQMKPGKKYIYKFPERYRDILRNQLKPAIRIELRGLLSSGVSAA
jgi:hypothetical protein